MSAGLKVSPSACKCVFDTLEHNAKGGGTMKLNFEGLKIQK